VKNKTVMMTVDDRVDYLHDALRSWQGVREQDDWMFLFMLEPTHKTQDAYDLIKAIGPKIQAIHVNENRLGVLRNPWTGVNLAVEKLTAEYIVLAENDIEVSTDVLEYQRWAAETYRSDPQILGACSWSDAQDNPTDHVVAATDFCPLTWGTWADRWQNVFRDTWDLSYSTGVGGHQAGWDWNIRLRVMGDRKFLFPRESRCTHIGVWGAHCRPEQYADTRAKSYVHDRPATDYKLVGADFRIPWPID
jgi:hypothetical protein